MTPNDIEDLITLIISPVLISSAVTLLVTNFLNFVGRERLEIKKRILQLTVISISIRKNISLLEILLRDHEVPVADVMPHIDLEISYDNFDLYVLDDLPEIIAPLYNSLLAIKILHDNPKYKSDMLSRILDLSILSAEALIQIKRSRKILSELHDENLFIFPFSLYAMRRSSKRISRN